MEEQLSNVQKIMNTVIEYCVNYSFQVVGALITLVVASFAGGWVAKIIMKLGETKKWDITLTRFLAGTVKLIIMVFAVIIALGKFGITIAPFVAALGAVAFGATYAIQGPLSNYGAGIGIILGRPFVVGDTIQVKEVNGLVEEVKLACTVLSNEDGVKITVPNKQIVGEVLYNSKANRIVEGVIGIAYGSDPETAIQAIRQALAQFPEVSSQPSAQIGIQEFADSSVNIGFRYWVPTIKYFQTSYKVNLAVFKALKAAKIEIPFPQREVRIIGQVPAV